MQGVGGSGVEVLERAQKLMKTRTWLCLWKPLVMTVTVCELETSHRKFVDLPIKHGDFPVRYFRLTTEGTQNRMISAPRTSSLSISHEGNMQILPGKNDFT